MKFIGRKFNKGIARESVRGTARAAQFWLPTTEISFDEKVEISKDESTFGVIESQSDSDVVKKYSEGSLSGIVNDDSIGLVFNAALGTCVTTGPTDSSAYTHVFSVKEDAQHQSLSLTVSEPNAEGASSLIFPLVMVNSLDLDFEVGQYPTFSMGFMGNIGSSTASTVSYSAPDNFRPQDGTVRIASAYSGLESGTAYSVRTGSISISKNLEDDHNIGSVEVTDRLNKQFQATGSLELVYDSRDMVNVLKDGSDRALMIRLTNTSKIIGTSTNPSVSVKLAKVRFHEVARNIGNDDIVTQTVNFEAYFSISDAKELDITLVNDVSSYA